MNRSLDKKFKRDYSNKEIIKYLQGVHKVLGRAPSSRELDIFPGPAPRTVIRRFGKWSTALEKAGMRPATFQLKRGEKSYIRRNWRKMSDNEIARKLGVNFSVVRYYRMNYSLWKNRKGTARSTFRRRALNLYGEACECCGIKMCEWHHIVPKSKNPNDWLILCPTCHAVLTRGLIVLRNRADVKAVLRPFVTKLYSDLKISSGNGSVYT